MKAKHPGGCLKRAVASVLSVVLIVVALVAVPLPASVPIVGNNTKQADAHNKYRSECTNQQKYRLVTKYRTVVRWRWEGLGNGYGHWIRHTESVPYTARIYYTERVCRNVAIPHSHPTISEAITVLAVCGIAGYVTRSPRVFFACTVASTPGVTPIA